MLRCRRAAWLLLLVAVPAWAGAARGQADVSSALAEGGLLSRLTLDTERGPVEITAERLEFDYRRLELAYRGRVEVKQGDMVLQADRLRAVLKEEAGIRVHEVVAEGKVRISQGERVATGGRAVFDQGKRTVTLSDHAVLQDGPNEVAGERVIVYLDEERSVVEGGGQPVRARLFPPNGSDSANTTAPEGGESDGAAPEEGGDGA